MIGRVLCLCIALGLLTTIPAFGATSEVGTCGSFSPQYSSIQAAVNASSPGDTINICPGTYTEQVFIFQSLTLQGFAPTTTGANLATITVPSGGLVTATAFSGSAVAPQVYIYNGANVTINNLTVDGQANGITGCAPDLIGIYFQNASGTVTHSAVINQVLSTTPVDLTGCQSGEGIFAESGGGTSNVNVNNSVVENFQKNGVTGNEVGTTLTATSNSIVGRGSTTGAAENGIQIAFGAKGTVTSNTIADNIWAPDTSSDPGDAAAGILIYASKSVSITSNRVTSTQFGIALAGDPVSGKANANTVSQNTVSTTHIFDAIDVCGNNNTVSSNVINSADESGIHLDDTCGGSGNSNSVMNNSVNLACAGILTGTGTTGNSLSGNTYLNVGNQVLAGDSCAATFGPAVIAAKALVKTGRVSSFSPARH
jgi:parallel beta-helix repeat protein